MQLVVHAIAGVDQVAEDFVRFHAILVGLGLDLLLHFAQPIELLVMGGYPRVKPGRGSATCTVVVRLNVYLQRDKLMNIVLLLLSAVLDQIILLLLNAALVIKLGRITLKLAGVICLI